MIDLKSAQREFKWMLIGLACGLALVLAACGESERQPKWVIAKKPDAAAQPPQETPTQESYSNRIKWATASEVDNFGFDIYRGDQEDGPFERINETPIAGAGNTDSPSYYEYVDETIDPTKSYYYYIESISLTGERQRFTGVNHAKPKIETATDPGEGSTP